MLNLDGAEAAEWTHRLTRTERTCGCKSGAALMFLAMVGWPLRLAVSGLPHSPVSIATAFLVYIAVVVGSAVVGKVAGIAVGRIRYLRLRRQFAGRLAALSAERGR